MSTTVDDALNPLFCTRSTYWPGMSPVMRKRPFDPITIRRLEPTIEAVASPSDARLVSVTTPSITPFTGEPCEVAPRDATEQRPTTIKAVRVRRRANGTRHLLGWKPPDAIPS